MYGIVRNCICYIERSAVCLILRSSGFYEHIQFFAATTDQRSYESKIQHQSQPSMGLDSLNLPARQWIRGSDETPESGLTDSDGKAKKSNREQGEAYQVWF